VGRHSEVFYVSKGVKKPEWYLDFAIIIVIIIVYGYTDTLFRGAEGGK
jgi:hypothetical protein